MIELETVRAIKRRRRGLKVVHQLQLGADCRLLRASRRVLRAIYHRLGQTRHTRDLCVALSRTTELRERGQSSLRPLTVPVRLVVTDIDGKLEARRIVPRAGVGIRDIMLRCCACACANADRVQVRCDGSLLQPKLRDCKLAIGTVVFAHYGSSVFAADGATKPLYRRVEDPAADEYLASRHAKDPPHPGAIVGVRRAVAWRT